MPDGQTDKILIARLRLHSLERDKIMDLFANDTQMIGSPVGTMYELRSHSLLPVGPRMTDKADSCGELSTAVITCKASCICGLGCGDGLTGRTFPSAALLYCSDNTNFLSVAPR